MILNKFILFWFLIFCVSIAAQNIDVSKLPTIQVTGTAEIQVVPDTAAFSFTVSKKNESVAEAKRENDATIEKVKDLAKRFSIKPSDVKTDYIRVSEVTKRVKIPNSDDDYENVFDGYQVSRSLEIKLRDMAKFESFLTSLLESGITSVSNVSFSSSEIRKYKDQARAAAIRAAKEKAQAIASEIGQSIGRAVSIEENNVDERSSYGLNSNNNISFSLDGDDDDNSTVGTITIKAQVEAEFLLN